MQEFTIQSENQNINPPNRNVQNQNPAVPAGQNPAANNPVKTKNNPNCLIILIVTALTILIVSIVIILYLHFSNKSSGSGENSEDVLGAEIQKQENLAVTTSPIPESLKDTIFYTDGFNIFKANKYGREVEQITNFPKEVGLKLSELQLISEDIIGFIKCGLENNELLCKVIKYNFIKKEILYYKNFGNKIKIEKLTWQDPNNYAYSKIAKTNNEIEIYYVNSKEEVLIDKIQYDGNREELFLEDSTSLSFSPNGGRLLYINTAGGEGFNFITYIYSLKGERQAQIEESTMPVWSDDNHIIYRKYSNKNSGFLHEFDINTQKSIRLENTHELSYNPAVLNRKITFWEVQTLGKSYTYDLDKNQINNITGDLVFPIWLNEGEVIAAEVRKCKRDECKTKNSMEYIYQFAIEDYYVYNLTTNKKEVIDVRSRYLKNGIATWYNRSF